MIGVYAVYMRTRIALQFQYRVAALIWMITLFIPTIMTIVVWRAVAGANTVHGYTSGDFAAYFLVAMVVEHVTFTWVYFDFEFQIRNGTLSPQLLKPLLPIHASVADNIGYKVVTLATVIPTFVVLDLAFQPVWNTNIGSLLLALPAVLLAAIMRFIVEYTFACVAFWTTRIGAFNDIYNALLMFLSGYWMPLAILPPPVYAVALVLPFRCMVAFPTELALGRLAPADIVQGFALELAWLAVALLAFRLVWQRAIRAYGAVGA
jgi:ABC-2 type transport system permease protein